jgi:predicted DNA-binding WGR domain protein
MLIKANLEKNSNSYYLLQLLQAGRKYYVWQAWGRIGTTIGSTKLTEDSSLGDAVATFTDKFAEKSGNTWSTTAPRPPAAAATATTRTTATTATCRRGSSRRYRRCCGCCSTGATCA